MKALMHTQIAVTLSLNIVTKTEDGIRLMTLPLVQLTRLILWFWTVWQIVNDLGFECVVIINDLTEVIILAVKITMITLNTLAFGLGVKL
jgi:hypothetical protein